MNPQDLADSLGIPTARLRELRDHLGLQEGVHWRRDPKDLRRVEYTDEGASALRLALLVAGETPRPHHAPKPEKHASAPPQAQGESPSGPSGTDRLELVRVLSRARQFPDGSFRHFANPRVILCERPTGEQIHVRVAESRNFIPIGHDGKPMTLWAQWTGDPAHWCLVGRCPRYPGRY